MNKRETEYQLDPAIGEDDFRIIARKRLARQDQEFQDRWRPLIDDINPLGRLLGYSAIGAAMEVHENWQKHTSANAKNLQLDSGEQLGELGGGA